MAFNMTGAFRRYWGAFQRSFLKSTQTALLTIPIGIIAGTGCADRHHITITQPADITQTTYLLRVYHNPYAEVDWQHDFRLKTQLHDHVGVSPDRIVAYDSAGYDVVSLMTYSGVASLSYSWHLRHWPPDAWLPSSVLGSLHNIKFFIPNGEEVGYCHLTSALMTTYIAKFELTLE